MGRKGKSTPKKEKINQDGKIANSETKKSSSKVTKFAFIFLLVSIAFLAYLIWDSGDTVPKYVSNYPLRIYTAGDTIKLSDELRMSKNVSSTLYYSDLNVRKFLLLIYDLDKNREVQNANGMLIFVVENDSNHSIVPNVMIMFPKEISHLEKYSPPGKYEFLFENDDFTQTKDESGAKAYYNIKNEYDGNYTLIEMVGIEPIESGEKEIYGAYFTVRNAFERTNKEKWLFGIQVDRSIDQVTSVESNSSFYRQIMIYDEDIPELSKIEIDGKKYYGISFFKEGYIQIKIKENYVPLQEGLSLLPSKIEKIQDIIAYTYPASSGQYSYLLFKDKNVKLDSEISRNLLLTVTGIIFGILGGLLIKWDDVFRKNKS